MILGIHQPHFFPWLGYFDKMAKSDVFVLLDQVQMEKGSYMYRNRILDQRGNICYLTISADKHGFLERPFNQIRVKDTNIWIPKHLHSIEQAYGRTAHFDEVWPLVKEIYEVPPETICQFDIRTIRLLAEILGIQTRLIMQSELSNVAPGKKNDLVLNICKAIGADGYLSGNGARKYTDEQPFLEAGITLQYQSLSVPEYRQQVTQEFIGGLSMLDMLFCIGIEETRRIFWDTVSRGNEFAQGG